MSNYGWLITKDFTESDAEGTIGPNWIKEDLIDWFEKGAHGIPPFGRVYKFKMYDDDHELYHAGILVANSENFGPLDDFGPYAGCTYIKFYNEDRRIWETL